VREVLLERIEPDPDELPPAALTESPLIDPYIMLTDMYGRPAPGDPDPTPQIALFFAAFYGICIGDAGYGIIIALASGIAIAMNRRKGRRNRLLSTIFQGGISAVIAGTFFGGWFGMDQSLLPSFLLVPASLLNSIVPDGGPFALSKQFLYATIALGLVQLLAGILLNFQKRWRSGERLTAVVEQTGWVLALLGLFPWLFNHYLLNGILYDSAGPVDRVLLFMLLAGAVIIFIMGGRSAPGFGKVGLGAMAAYGIVNLLADALSYSRLFALSLSGGIIASVVNQIAGMLPGTDIPVIGLFISVPIIVFGHLFNILMSLLGGFIHTARLQFVEYFGKYYEGTGSPFVPLSYNPQFINIIRRKA
jgi:V/A-type H+/Na+-transporting ATPase subunit I